MRSIVLLCLLSAGCASRDPDFPGEQRALRMRYVAPVIMVPGSALATGASTALELAKRGTQTVTLAVRSSNDAVLGASPEVTLRLPWFSFCLWEPCQLTVEGQVVLEARSAGKSRVEFLQDGVVLEAMEFEVRDGVALEVVPEFETRRSWGRAVADVQPGVELASGETVKLGVLPRDARGEVLVAGDGFTVSSASDALLVQRHSVKGMQPGEATVTVRLGALEKRLEVTVKPGQ